MDVDARKIQAIRQGGDADTQRNIKKRMRNDFSLQEEQETVSGERIIWKNLENRHGLRQKMERQQSRKTG